MTPQELDGVKQFAENEKQAEAVIKFLKEKIYNKEMILKLAEQSVLVSELGTQVIAYATAIKLLETGFGELEKLREVGEPDKEERNPML